MLTLSTLVALVVVSGSEVVLGLHDAHGWGLRVLRHTSGPYIVGETYEHVRVKITLINMTGQARQHWPLNVAMKATELEVLLHYPDGRPVRCHFDPDMPKIGAAQARLEAGKSVSAELSLRDFGFQQFFEAGKYQAKLRFTTPQGA